MQTINGHEVSKTLIYEYLTGQHGPLIPEDDGMYAEDGSLSIHEAPESINVVIYAEDGSSEGVLNLELS